MPGFHTIFEDPCGRDGEGQRQQPERDQNFTGRGRTLRGVEVEDARAQHGSDSHRDRGLQISGERRRRLRGSFEQDETSLRDRSIDERDHGRRDSSDRYDDWHGYGSGQIFEPHPQRRQDDSSSTTDRQPRAGVAVIRRAFTDPDGRRVIEEVRMVRPSEHDDEQGRSSHDRSRRGYQTRGAESVREPFESHEDFIENIRRDRERDGLPELPFFADRRRQRDRPRTSSPPPRTFSPPRHQASDRYEDQGRSHSRDHSPPARSPRHGHRWGADDGLLASLLQRGLRHILRTPPLEIGQLRHTSAQSFHDQIPGFYYQLLDNRLYGNDTPPRSRSPSPFNQRRNHSPIDLDDYHSDDEVPDIPLSPRAASNTAINSLPTKRVTDSDKGNDGKANCPICMEEVVVGTTVSTMPCGHWFHFECIKPWLEQNGTCPNCRMAYGTEGRETHSGEYH